MSSKIIISSRSMLKFLDDRLFLIQPYEWCPVIVNDNEFFIDGRRGSVECYSSDKNKMQLSNTKTQSIINLWVLLSAIEDQPITIELTDSEIKIHNVSL